jgi:alpha-beta hydrolase superfamily lysophospholipase
LVTIGSSTSQLLQDSEYYEEITVAIRQIEKITNGEIFLLGHSTGGSIASNYE